MTHLKKLTFSWDWTLLLIGAALRLRQYLSGRSLWADEAMLALNIVNRDFMGLLKPLDYDQGAPIGFLWVMKSINLILGRTELVLRLFPFAAGILSLYLFYLLIRKITDRAGTLTALALFAVNPSIIYYSSESKQYIVDVAIALGLLALAYPVFSARENKQDLIRLGVGGIIALWFSHPALFVLAGMGVALVVQFLQKREYTSLRTMVIIALLWLADLGALYFISLRHLSRNEYLATYWEAGFIPMPPWSNPGWFPVSYGENVQFQFGIQILPFLVLIFLVMGWVLLYREKQSFALAIALIVVISFTASALRYYPVSGRLSLFLIPLWCILLGAAIDGIQRTLASRKFISTASAILLGGYLLIAPAIVSLENFISPKYYEHIRPTMSYLSESWKEDDVIFVSFWAEPAFRFYAPFYGLEGIEFESSEYEDYPDPQKLKSRIEPLLGQKRVWVLFSHVYEEAGFNERDFLVSYLNEVGEQRREILKPGTSVYLFFYDLSR
ncbi:MAG TPA: glycosyltransferase family 39 protein [Anaerolineales bacterium]|nr:glycosyltransferase family 39 protein [Anaerolineales bacterium]